MKILPLFAIAVIALAMGSCAKKSNSTHIKNDRGTVSAEQSQIEERVMVELDSLVEVSMRLKPVDGVFRDGKVQLSEEELKVKPTYLLDLALAEDLSTLAQKYRAMGMMTVDLYLAKIYEMETEEYETTLGKLVADVNDPVLQPDMQADTAMIKEIVQKEKMAGRINYVWQSGAASLIETLYLVSQNTEKFLPAFDDAAVVNITHHVALLRFALSDLEAYDTDAKALNDALAPIDEIDATTVDQFKEELVKIKPEIEAVRATLLK